MEICLDEEHNPIKQDTKKGKLRFITHGKLRWNYGAVPQTWEAKETLEATGFPGDGDPLDVVEISEKPIPQGSVVPVRFPRACAHVRIQR
jgi:inorganic pyrophosphatase